VLRVLRPAESAVRRLIVVAAQGLVVKPAKLRPAPQCLKIAGRTGSRISFRLFDPRKRFDWLSGRKPLKRPRLGPRIRFIDVRFDPRVPLFRQASAAVPVPPVPEPDDTVSARALCRRLMAIKQALDDLPRQARRYARWRAKPFEIRRPRLVSPLRPGKPPGYRKVPAHEVEEILSECRGLANIVPPPNSS
jgi:hypothetical protein